MRKNRGKKLLVASLGIAAISYTACVETSGNLMAPPEPQKDAAADSRSDASMDGSMPTDGSPDQSQ